jgi:hypothetical protein
MRTSNIQLRTSNIEVKRFKAFTSMFDVGRSMFDVRISRFSTRRMHHAPLVRGSDRSGANRQCACRSVPASDDSINSPGLFTAEVAECAEKEETPSVTVFSSGHDSVTLGHPALYAFCCSLLTLPILSYLT